MGNVYSSFNQESVSQTQISQANSKCNQSATASIQDVTITAIDSHLGDIELSNLSQIKQMDCVMTTVTQASSTAAISNVSQAEQKALAFQATINSAQSTNITDIASFQQSLIDQACTQSVSDSITDVVLTFIDSTTGNIKLANTLEVESFSCNLSASAYQSASAQVTDFSSAKQSASCCGFDLSALIPLVFGIIGLGVVAKMVQKSQTPPSSGSDMNDDLQRALAAAALGNTVANLRSAAASGPRSQEMGSLTSSRPRASTSAATPK